MKHQIEITADGSHTLYVPGINERYHSAHGAIQESKWVYIEAGLKQCLKSSVNIFEIGFGTGLNAFLALNEAEKSGCEIHYVSMEKYPLSLDEAKALNYAAEIASLKQKLFEELHSSPWNENCPITSRFTLRKMQADAANPANFPEGRLFDVVFFDAFAPGKQPEMWTQEIFDKLFDLCAGGGIVTTYCAKGAVRRMMQNAGFAVERLPGPPGKREILRATKP